MTVGASLVHPRDMALRFCSNHLLALGLLGRLAIEDPRRHPREALTSALLLAGGDLRVVARNLRTTRRLLTAAMQAVGVSQAAYGPPADTDVLEPSVATACPGFSAPLEPDQVAATATHVCALLA